MDQRYNTSPLDGRPPLRPRAASEGIDGLISPGPGARSRRLAAESHSPASTQSPAGFQPYHRPIKREDFTSPPLTSEQPTAPITLRGTHVDETNGTGIIAIGMALGSPAQNENPYSTTWQPQVITTVTAQPDDDSRHDEQIQADEMKPKSKKWNLFSRSKSKRTKNGEGQYDTQQPPNASPNAKLTRAASSAAAFRRTSSEDMVQRHTSRIKRPVNRVQTAPIRGEAKDMSSPSKFRKNKSKGRDPGRIDPHAHDIMPQSDRYDTIQEPRLDVEIPDITMERYSIMFAGLLERRSATNLLARRQATQEKLRALREVDTKDEGDPNQLISNTGATFKQNLPAVPPIRVAPVHNQHTVSRLRSNTSPAAIPSPASGGFPAESHRTVEKPNQRGEPQRPVKGQEHLGQQQETPRTPHIMRLASVRSKPPNRGKVSPPMEDGPDLKSKFHRQTSSAESAAGSSTTVASTGRSSKTSADNNNYSYKAPARDSETIPMTTWNASIARPLTSSHRSFEPTSQDTRQPQSDSPSQDGIRTRLSSGTDECRDDNEFTTNQDPVEISIARQISVSREQRRMLKPLQMHPIEGRRIAETKSSTPRLVNPSEDASSPLAMHRKSSRVVLESV